MTVKTAVVLPAATVTEEGTIAAGSLLVKDTGNPPVGAAAVNVIVPVTEVLLIAVSELTVSKERPTVALGVIVRDAVLFTPLYAPVIVAVAVVVPKVVLTLNVVVVLPAATVTDAGTVADVLLLDNDTDAPPVGAGVVNVTVPVDDVPPATLLGFRAIEESAAAAGVTVNSAVLLVLL